MDINKDGTIDKNDLRGAFDNVGVLMTEGQLDELLGEIGGPCSYDNMVKMFQEKMAGGRERITNIGTLNTLACIPLFIRSHSFTNIHVSNQGNTLICYPHSCICRDESKNTFANVKLLVYFQRDHAYIWPLITYLDMQI